jgi:hypothetical protein
MMETSAKLLFASVAAVCDRRIAGNSFETAVTDRRYSCFAEVSDVIHSCEMPAPA